MTLIPKVLRAGLLIATATAIILPNMTQAFAGQYGKRQLNCDYQTGFCEPARHQFHKKHQRPIGQHRQMRRDNDGKWIAAGIVGLAVGAIIANQHRNSRDDIIVGTIDVPEANHPSVAQPFPHEPQMLQPSHGFDTNEPVYNQPVYHEPQMAKPKPYIDEPEIVSIEQEYSPWSPAWYEWCHQKYRSFNPQKGTYRGYDGIDHFCVVK